MAPDPQPNPTQPSRPSWPVVLLALLCFAISWGGAAWLALQTEAKAQAEFQALTQRVAADVQRRLNQPVALLSGMRGAHAVRGGFGEADLATFAGARSAGEALVGVQALALVRRQPRAERAALELAMRASGEAGFTVRDAQPPTAGDDFVITGEFPRAGNEAAVGFNMASEPQRATLMRQAVALDRPLISGRLTLVQDARQAAALLYVMPLSLPLPAGRQVDRLITAAVVLPDLLADVGPITQGGMHFELLPSAGIGAGGAPLFSLAAQGPPSARLAHEGVTVLGQEMKLQARASALFERSFPSWPPLLLAGAGTLLGAMLLWLTQSHERARREAEALAKGLTADLQRLALVAQRTTNGVALCDAQRRIVWINEGFTRLSGYSLDEARGFMPGELLEFDQTDPTERQRLRSALATAQPVRAELLNRRKDHSTFWAAVEGQPLHDEHGVLSGYIVIKTDVSERKAVVEQLRQEQLRLQNIITSTDVGTWEWDVPSGQTWLNERWATMLGYTLAELQPTTIDTFQGLVHPDDLPQVLVRTAAHFEGRAPVYASELRMRHKAGHWVWVAVMGRLMSRDARGGPLRMCGTHQDVTERRNVAERFERERERQANILAATEVGTWEWHLDAHTMVVNERWPASLGQPVSLFTDEDGLATLIHPEDRAPLQGAVRSHLRGDSPRLYTDFRMLHAQGHWVWFQANGQMLTRSADGRGQVLFGVVADVSERKRTELALAEGRDLLDRTGRIGGVGGWELRLGDDHMRWTAQTARIHDLPADHQPDLAEALGYFAPEAQLAVYQALNEARERGGGFDLELPIVTAQDRRAWVRLVGEAELEAGRPVRVVGAVQDITQRRRAEQEAKRSAELLRGAIDAIDQPFALFGPDDRLVFCNERYRLADPRLTELVQPGVRFADLAEELADQEDWVPDGLSASEWVQAQVARRRAGPITELVHYANGRVMRVIDRALPDGHVVSFRMDLTEETQAKQAAEQAALTKSQFLANMSHEIRTPLNAVLGMMQLLGRTALDARQTDYLTKAEGAARALLGLVNDTLDFSKIDAGKLELEALPFRLDTLLRDLAVILGGTLRQKPVELLFDTDPNLPPLLVGDALRLQQVLVNLAGNAIKFTEQGSVTVRVAQLAQEGATLRLAFEVADTGIGIAPEHLERIFASFSQAEASTTRRYGGTGLGLAISQRLVGLMGGRLGVKSQPGRGSRFGFEISLAIGELAVADARATAPPLHVLVVDAHPQARALLARTSAGLGWTALQAADADAALAAAPPNPPLDALLWAPRAHSIEELGRLAALRQHLQAWAPQGQRLPVIALLTVHGRELLGQAPAAEQALVDGVLIKPVTATMVFDAVHEARARLAPGPVALGLSLVSPQRLAGLRLLLAEDNPINQQVAMELLSAEGAFITLAHNGQEALDCLRHKPTGFDLLLMDLQMPVMDGLTATRALRQDLGLQLPVIAMTANASVSDRAACLAAGMNDHVGKPFDLDALVATLRAWAGWASLPPTAPTIGLGAAAGHGWEPMPALERLGGRQDLYARMLQRFAQELPGTLKLLAAPALNDEAAAQRRRLLHTLRGTLSTLGAAQATQALARAEVLTEPAASRAAEAALREADRGLQMLLLQLQASRAEPVASAAGLSVPEARAALHKLQALLAVSDAGALDALAVLAHAPLPSHFEPLREAAEGFDFPGALALAQAWDEALAVQA